MYGIARRDSGSCAFAAKFLKEFRLPILLYSIDDLVQGEQLSSSHSTHVFPWIRKAFQVRLNFSQTSKSLRESSNFKKELRRSAMVDRFNLKFEYQLRAYIDYVRKPSCLLGILRLK